jgi:hypothetical protein
MSDALENDKSEIEKKDISEIIEDST